MTSYEDNRAALIREREARQAAYATAAAEREALPDDADCYAIRRAEARVRLSLDAMQEWGDPLPEAMLRLPFAAHGHGGKVRMAAQTLDVVEAIAHRIAKA